MTIIEVAKILAEDGSRRFTRPGLGLEGAISWEGGFQAVRHESQGGLFLDPEDLAADDWEEVK